MRLIGVFGLYAKYLPMGLLSSSLLGLPFWILNMSHKKELLRSQWVNIGYVGPL